MDYKVIKDNRRKRLSMSVEKDGTVAIKVPKWTGQSVIDNFYKANLGWIKQRRQRLEKQKGSFVQLSENDIALLKQKAKTVLSLKTKHYADIMGVECDGIKITSAKKRWGSCRRLNGRYTICYSWRTMLLSDRQQDYIVVHELAHVIHFDHSKSFYDEIEKVLPDWKILEEQVDNFNDIYLY